MFPDQAAVGNPMLAAALKRLDEAQLSSQQEICRSSTRNTLDQTSEKTSDIAETSSKMTEREIFEKSPQKYSIEMDLLCKRAEEAERELARMLPHREQIAQVETINQERKDLEIQLNRASSELSRLRDIERETETLRVKTRRLNVAEEQNESLSRENIRLTARVRRLADSNISQHQLATAAARELVDLRERVQLAESATVPLRERAEAAERRLDEAKDTADELLFQLQAHTDISPAGLPEHWNYQWNCGKRTGEFFTPHKLFDANISGRTTYDVINALRREGAQVKNAHVNLSLNHLEEDLALEYHYASEPGQELPSMPRHNGVPQTNEEWARKLLDGPAQHLLKFKRSSDVPLGEHSASRVYAIMHGLRRQAPEAKVNIGNMRLMPTRGFESLTQEQARLRRWERSDLENDRGVVNPPQCGWRTNLLAMDANHFPIDSTLERVFADSTRNGYGRFVVLCRFMTRAQLADVAKHVGGELPEDEPTHAASVYPNHRTNLTLVPGRAHLDAAKAAFFDGKLGGHEAQVVVEFNAERPNETASDERYEFRRLVKALRKIDADFGPIGMYNARGGDDQFVMGFLRPHLMTSGEYGI